MMMKCCSLSNSSGGGFRFVVVLVAIIAGSSLVLGSHYPHPTPAPTQAPVPTTDVDIAGCFSKDMTVQVQDRGAVAMKDLQIGDKVLTGRFGYSAVYAFGHYAPNLKGEFLTIHTTTGNKNAPLPLEVTDEHLLYLDNKSNPVRASSIRVGDILQPHGARVTKIDQKVTKTGLYAPLTAEAQVVVNGIQASSYVALQPPGDDEYGVFQNGRPFLSLHDGVHMVLTPFRMICTSRLLATDDFCHSYNEHGMPYHVGHGIQILQWIDQQSWQLQATLFVLAFPLFGIMMALEKFWLVGALGLIVVTMMKIWNIHVYVRHHHRGSINNNKNNKLKAA
jgi:hypothetical protein